MPRRALHSLVLCIAASPCLGAQAAWRLAAASPSARVTPGFEYDSVANRVLAFGGFNGSQFGDTYAFENGAWSTVQANAAPLFSGGPAAAFDSARNRLVEYGRAWTGSPDALTYEFDGAQWFERDDLAVLPFLINREMAFDESRGVCVMYGEGFTWEYDGNAWTQRFPATTPSPRIDYRMTYHAGRQTVVLHGGRPNTGVSSSFGDLWEFDGIDWTLLDDSGPPRVEHGFVYDSIRDRLVVFGGRDFLTVFDDTWEWDGNSWSAVNTATAPSARVHHGMAFDPTSGQVVMFGGAPQFFPPYFGDTWTYDGVNWTQGQFESPSERNHAAMAYDTARDKAILYGGFDEPLVELNGTWELEGPSWTQRFPATQPPASWGHVMTYDEQREVTVLVRTDGDLVSTHEVWEFDGDDWHLRGSAPQPRHAAIAYDSLRGRSLMFGGSDSPFTGFPPADDVLRAWDGNTWIDIPTASAPSPRQDHAMAYDRRRDRLVLFGGRVDGGVAFGDTWEFDGQDWHLITNSGPGQRYGMIMTYDIARDRTVLHGGRLFPGSGFADTWEWDGSSWTQVAPSSVQGPGAEHAGTYDSSRNRFVSFKNGLIYTYETSRPASDQGFGSGCVGTAGAPNLQTQPFGLPWIGDTLQLELTQLTPIILFPAFLVIGQDEIDVDLTPIQAIGCDLLVQPDFHILLANQFGAATASIPIPADPALATQEFVMQGIAVDPLANPAGFTTSNGLRIVPGIR